MSQLFSNTLIHIVFSTKHRQNFIDDDIEEQLFGYIGNTCNELQCKTIRVRRYRNHAHILCRLYSPLSQSDLVKEIKVNSSNWMKEQGKKYKNFYWQDGFAVFSVNQLGSGNLIRYIENQKVHHQKQTFKDEYRSHLKSNNLEWDENTAGTNPNGVILYY